TNLAADISTAGTLTVSDVDSPQSFVAQPATSGIYGIFAVDSAGAWSYTASSAHNDVAAGTTNPVTFPAPIRVGTLGTVTINIPGPTRAPGRSPTRRSSALTNRAADISTAGTLTVSDVDSPASFVAQPATSGIYGIFAVDAAGAWSYTASSAH